MATFEVLSVLLILKSMSGVHGTLSVCDEFSDICSYASSSPLLEDYSRSPNCIYNSTYHLSDRNLIQKWYKSNHSMLTYCPEVKGCGAENPLWLNGSIPTESDGVVNSSVCKRGKEANECCVKTYDIKIRNCSTFIAYCLTPTTESYERYCFGENGTCLAPPTTRLNNTGSNEETNTENDATTMAVVIVSFSLIGAILIVAFALKYFTLRELPCSFQRNKSNIVHSARNA